MRPSSYRNQILPCCDTCIHCDFSMDYNCFLCLYGDDQDNLDDFLNYGGEDKLDFVDLRQVYVTSICDKYEPNSLMGSEAI